MRVTVVGLWHLGTVVAAGLAAAGHDVVGFDWDETVVAGLRRGQPPLFEPGLEELVRRGLSEGKLSFSGDPEHALAGAEVVWIAYDTPVDEDDRADVEYVIERAVRLFPYVPAGATVIVSSQVPVGSTRHIEDAFARARPGTDVGFAYSPENLRLGKSLEVFRNPDRVVVGVRAPRDRARIEALLAPITGRIEWMSVESAEMAKHAINAFLALSVAFANEIAEICEEVGADGGEVERALKTEARIGPRAYLSPGAAFAGGTLARDVVFLAGLGADYGRPTQLVSAIKTSNDAHKLWAARKLEQLLDVRDCAVAVWGLTYKPGTSTLRRSSALELCAWLVARGARVQAHDPVVTSLPDEARGVRLCPTHLGALEGASALVVATEWPEYRGVSADAIVGAMAAGEPPRQTTRPAGGEARHTTGPLVLDAGSFLKKTLGEDARVRYVTVGRARA
jgi:UDPglucose 6-dehydrogenase